MTGLAPIAGPAPVDLPGVTLVAVTSVAVPATVRALEICLRHCRFDAALLLSDVPPVAAREGTMPAPGIAWRPIAPITSHAAYSHVLLTQLAAHIETSHALLVQWDGYVLRPDAWRAEFLEYDYIGAPWPHFADGMIVGNGGFSLRSKRLLDAVGKLRIRRGEPEDVAICRTHRPRLEQEFGIRFAPPELARRFAFEREAARGDEFGFHGIFNLAKLLPRAELRRLLGSLEPSLLAPSERRELLAHGFRRADPALVALLLRRMLAARRRR